MNYVLSSIDTPNDYEQSEILDIHEPFGKKELSDESIEQANFGNFNESNLNEILTQKNLEELDQVMTFSQEIYFNQEQNKTTSQSSRVKNPEDDNKNKKVKLRGRIRKSSFNKKTDDSKVHNRNAKDNIIKMVNTEEKKNNIKNLIEESFKDLENNKSERSAKIRNSENKRNIRFINTKTALNTFKDKINLINKNFNKTIKKFHKNMNLILNTDANAIVNNKIKNDPMFLNQIITLTKSNVGLTNVDNTSDANKPVSTSLNFSSNQLSISKLMPPSSSLATNKLYSNPYSLFSGSPMTSSIVTLETFILKSFKPK